jgi:hypothetical protein
MKDKYQVTGNEYLSLPTLRERDGAVEGLTFLHMGAKGMLELKGNEDAPLLRPFITLDGRETALENLNWSREHYWIPSFTAQSGTLKITGTVLCPLNERAFFYRLKIRNDGQGTARCGAGLKGCWAKTLHEVNESKPVGGQTFLLQSNWNHHFVMEMRTGLPLFAWAPIFEDAVREHSEQAADGSIRFTLEREWNLAPYEEAAVDYIFGLGYEEVAASTSAKELLRRGFDKMQSETRAWLSNRERRIEDAKLKELLNTNMFFSFFFASGRTIDSEEFVLMTSRSPRYYVSCAYWDRDSLLWSFPSILMADREYAREILKYVFTKQIRNVGIHSRFIDGTVLEPGFELDELCAPLIALEKYLQTTGDEFLLREPYIQDGIRHILRLLDTKKHPELDLYETFLQPTDDTHVYPYLTYDNVLVWRVLTDLSRRLNRPELLNRAEHVREAIRNHFIKERDKKRFFCWSADLNGKYDVYDEPPGSLLLLPYYGFCEADDPVYLNTSAMIRDPGYRYSFAGKPIAEIGCAHAPHPWVLSIANSLLCGHKATAKEHLLRTQMDNGIACESVHEETGECTTGEAFATCAGFLAYALDTAFGQGGE